MPIALMRTVIRPFQRGESMVIVLACTIALAVLLLAVHFPALATPPFFILGALAMLCTGQGVVLWTLRSALRRRYLCGGPPSVGGIWICPLLATGRTRADQQRGEVQDVMIPEVTPLTVQRGAVYGHAPTVLRVETDALRILLVEDDAVSRYIMTHQLQGAGHSVKQAQDGGQGLYLLGSEQPDVMVLDLHLPTLTGQQIVRVKADVERAQHTHARVVVVTADAAATAEAQDLGADAFLVKPVTGQQLVQTVQTVMRAQPHGSHKRARIAQRKV